jgi:hypothetical protein
MREALADLIQTANSKSLTENLNRPRKWLVSTACFRQCPVVNIDRGIAKLAIGVPLLIETAPWAIGGIGAAPESGGASLVFAIPAVMSAKDSVGGVFLIRRGVRQVREAWDAPSRGEWQNLLGVLPFGSHFDDPGEFSAAIGKIRKLSWWEKAGELTTW